MQVRRFCVRKIEFSGKGHLAIFYLYAKNRSCHSTASARNAGHPGKAGCGSGGGASAPQGISEDLGSANGRDGADPAAPRIGGPDRQRRHPGIRAVAPPARWRTGPIGSPRERSRCDRTGRPRSRRTGSGTGQGLCKSATSPTGHRPLKPPASSGHGPCADPDKPHFPWLSHAGDPSQPARQTLLESAVPILRPRVQPRSAARCQHGSLGCRPPCAGPGPELN